MVMMETCPLDVPSSCFTQNQPCEPLHEGRIVGFYTQRERTHKIAKYKQKLQKWKKQNKNAFSGRSRVAKKKLRYFGRFIKSEDFKNKVLSDEQIIKNN